MNPYTRFTHFLQNRYQIRTPFAVWLQKPNEEPSLIYASGGCQSSLPQISSSGEHEIYHVEQQKNSVTYSYLYPHDYMIALHFPEQADFVLPDDHQQIWLIFHLVYHEQMALDMSRRTEKLIEGIHDISSSLDLNQLLKKIVKNALDVIPFADAGLLHLYDPDIDRLTPKGVVGFDEEKIQHFKLRVGESIAGKVYQDGIPRVYNTHKTTFQGMSDISEENLYHLNYSRDLSNLHSLLCVPVSSGTKKFGVMVVHKFQSERKFLEEDLFLLKGFASQAAIAIQNAYYYTQVKDTLDEMAVLSEQLKLKNEYLQQRNVIHHELLQISLQNQGIKPIIAFLNEKINKPVMFFDYIENRFHRLHPQARPAVGVDEIEMLILSGPRHSHFYLKICDSVNNGFVYLHPIWLGSVFLGFVMAETASAFLSEFDTITIEQSSSILALELVKRQTLTEMYYKKTHEFFNELLENKDPELLKKKGKEFAFSPFSFAMVGLFEIHSAGDQQKMDASIQRFILRLKNALQGREMILFGFHHQVTLLITLPDPHQVQNIVAAIQSVVTQWEKEGNDAVTGGFGSVVEGIANLSKSYEEAKRTLSYLAKTNRKRLLRYEDLGVNRLFVNHSQHEIETFVEEIFAPLRAYGKNSSLEQTLLVYMASNGSVTESTKKLHIHFNTLYQRLKKIEDLLNVNFQNREDVLKLQLACFLRETL